MPEFQTIDGKRWSVPEGTPPEMVDQIRSDMDKEIRITGMGPVGAGVTYGAQGINRGLMNVLGAPTDLVGAGMGKLMDVTGASEAFPGVRRGVSQPVGGSEQLGGLMASTGATFRDFEQVPEGYRPIARAGETVGESIPFAALPFFAASRLGTKAATGTFAPFVEAARTAPVATALAEGTAAAGAGIGAGIAEAAAPGNPWARMGGELVGGVVSPVTIITGASKKITGRLRQSYDQIASGFTRAGAEQAAARQAQRFVKTFGGSPADVALTLEQPSVSGAKLTAGQKSGDVALQALENKLIAESQVFGVKTSEQIKENILVINEAMRRAAASGDPEDLVRLAAARRDYWDSLVETRMAIAEQKLAQAAESVAPAEALSTGANLQARKIAEDAMEDARGMEKVMWGRIPKDEIVSPTRLKAASKEATEGLLKGEKLDIPAPINMFIRATVKKGEATAGDMLTLRGRILSEMRKIRGSQAPDWDMHRRLGVLSDSILDDLADLNPAAAEARDFSRTLNDRFSRGYVGRALGFDAQGGERIPPEMLLERGVGAGAAGRGPGRALASEQLETAATPFGEMPPTARLQEMRQAEEQVIRDMARKAVDPETGRITPRSMERFRRDNAELMARFPEIDQSLASAADATRIYGSQIKKLQMTDKFVKREAAFAKILPPGLRAADVDVSRMFTKMMASDTPVGSADKVFRMARQASLKGNKDALKGAGQVYTDYLLSSSVDSAGLISGKRLTALLDAHDGKVLASAMQNGVIDAPKLARIRQIADEATRLEGAMRYPGRLDTVIEEPSAMLDIMARVSGANIGGSTGLARASGSGLVLAHAGSKYMRKLVEQIPAAKVRDVLMEAVEDPFLMADLLKRPVNDRQWQTAVESIRKKLEAKGILQRVGEGIFVGRAGAFGQTAVPATLEDER